MSYRRSQPLGYISRNLSNVHEQWCLSQQFSALLVIFEDTWTQASGLARFRRCIYFLPPRHARHVSLANVTTLRSLYAITILSVCLSVTLVHPTQPVEIFGNFFTIRWPRDSSFLMPKTVGGGRPFPLKFAFKVTNPFQTAKFRPISAHSASTVIASEKN